MRIQPAPPAPPARSALPPGVRDRVVEQVAHHPLHQHRVGAAVAVLGPRARTRSRAGRGRRQACSALPSSLSQPPASRGAGRGARIAGGRGRAGRARAHGLAASARIASASLACAGGSGGPASGATSASPASAVSGVRRSCDSEASKVLRRRSVSAARRACAALPHAPRQSRVRGAARGQPAVVSATASSTAKVSRYCRSETASVKCGCTKKKSNSATARKAANTAGPRPSRIAAEQHPRAGTAWRCWRDRTARAAAHRPAPPHPPPAQRAGNCAAGRGREGGRVVSAGPCRDGTSVPIPPRPRRPCREDSHGPFALPLGFDR